MTTKLAYLTSPAPNVYVINLQVEDGTPLQRYEISEAHLANIIVDGASFALRKSRVINPQTEAENERAGT